MKNKPVSLLVCGLTGIGYGIPATLVCMTLIGGYREPIGELAAWTIASALIGILSGVTFGNERLNLPAALALHGLGSLIIAVVTAAVCGYSEDPVQILLAVLPVFVIIYAVIYAINYAIIKHHERQINRALREKE